MTYTLVDGPTYKGLSLIKLFSMIICVHMTAMNATSMINDYSTKLSLHNSVFIGYLHFLHNIHRFIQLGKNTYNRICLNMHEIHFTCT